MMELVTPQLERLFRMELEVGGSREVGETPLGRRRVVWVSGGRFAGDRLCGEVLPGEDWITERPDGVVALDVRLPLLTHDGCALLMRYQGYRHGPADTMARLARGEAVPPADYYFRIAPVFEAPSGPYAWLGRTVAVGTGARLGDRVVYDVFAVK